MKSNKYLLKCLWVFTLMLISIFAYSQSAVKKVTKDACKFFEKIDLNDISSIKTETVLPKLFGELSTKYANKITSELGYDLNSPDDMQAFGELVALDLIENCEAAKDFFLAYNELNEDSELVQKAEEAVDPDAQEDYLTLNLPDTVTTNPDNFAEELSMIFPEEHSRLTETEETYITFVGTFIGFEKDYFYYLIVEDFLGNQKKFLWADYFEGSEYLIDKQDHLIGKSISIRFKDQDFFNPDFYAYTSKSVIKSFPF